MRNLGVKILQIIFLAAAIGLLIFLFWKNYSPLGQQTIVYNIGERSSFTAGLWPSTRVEKFTCVQPGGCSQKLFDNPVYINLLMPRPFQTLVVEMTYQNPDNVPVKLGIKSGPGWQFFEAPLETLGSSDEWQIAQSSFDLNRAYITQRQISLVVSAPQLKNRDHYLLIKQIKFILNREPWL